MRNRTGPDILIPELGTDAAVPPAPPPVPLVEPLPVVALVLPLVLPLLLPLLLLLPPIVLIVEVLDPLATSDDEERSPEIFELEESDGGEVLTIAR